MTQAVRDQTKYSVILCSLPCVVSEIAIERCMGSSLFASLCFPHTTTEEDAMKGKWVRVERDLNRQLGLWQLVCLFFFQPISLLNGI
jgi:hypothetical protein